MMNAGIGTEAGQFLFWEYINGIFDAVWKLPLHVLNKPVLERMAKICPMMKRYVSSLIGHLWQPVLHSGYATPGHESYQGQPNDDVIYFMY